MKKPYSVKSPLLKFLDIISSLTNAKKPAFSGKTFFVILTTGRSGSSYLRDLLGNRPDCSVSREILSRIKSRGGSPRDQIGWIRSFYAKCNRKSLAAFGFKTKLKDIMDPAGFVKVMRSTDARIILLYREDRFKQALSRIRARELFRKTGKWNRRLQDPILPPSKVNIEDFRKSYFDTISYENKLFLFAKGLTDIPILKIGYEDLLHRMENSLRKINLFLGLNHMKVESGLVKNTPDSIEHAVLNYSELKRWLCSDDSQMSKSGNAIALP